MKLIIVMLFTLSSFLGLGCSSRSPGSTSLFFKQEIPTRVVNINTMEECIQSGAVQLHREDLTLIYYFRNCEIKVIRKMKEYEMHQWGLKRK